MRSLSFGSRARAGPVRGHAADVAGHGGDGQAVLALDLVAVLEQERAGPGPALRRLDDAAGAIAVSPCARGPSERAARGRAASGSAMFFTCAPGGLLTVGPTSNIAIVAPGRLLAEDARVGGAGRAAADDGDVDRGRVAVPLMPSRHQFAGCSRTDSADSVVG